MGGLSKLKMIQTWEKQNYLKQTSSVKIQTKINLSLCVADNMMKPK